MKKVVALVLLFALALSACTAPADSGQPDPGQPDGSLPQPAGPPVQPDNIYLPSGAAIGLRQTEYYLGPDEHSGDYTSYGYYNYSGEDYQAGGGTVPPGIISRLDLVQSENELIPGTGTYIYVQKESDHLYVGSGREVFRISNRHAPEGSNWNRIRDNVTGYMMGVYQSEAEAEQARREITAAMQILSGEQIPDGPALIVNGRLRPELDFFVEDGLYWLPLSRIAELRGWQWEETSFGIRVENFVSYTDYLSKEPPFPSSEVLQDPELSYFPTCWFERLEPGEFMGFGARAGGCASR